MKSVAIGILCSGVCLLTACGGGGGSSSDKPKSSSSSLTVVSSSSLAASSTVAVSSTAAVSSAAEVSSAVTSSLASSATVTSSSADTSVAASSIPGAGGGSSIASSQGASSTPASSIASSLGVSSSVASSLVASSTASLASSSASSVAPVALTGVFVDSAVAGISYQTSPGNFSGVTSPTGQYQYAEGDTVIFSIGAISLPPVTAKGVVTPIDMKGTGSDQVVTNIAVLLQSLDADGDPSNGISIPTAAAAVATSSVTFDQPYSSFASAVLPVVRHSDPAKVVVDDTAAVAHLNESLADVKAKSLIGTWYIDGYDEVEDTEYSYVLFVLDEHHYVFIDQYGAESELEVGTYSWNVETGVVTTGIDFETENVLDSYPPMATGNTLEVDGDTLTFTDDDEVFVATRLKPSQESPLKGGWFIGDEVVFAFTDTHYFMGQYSETEEDNTGYPGVEIGTYNYNGTTKAITYSTLLDSNGQWGLSHPCAIISDSEHPQYEDSNFFNCGPNGAAVLQTMDVTGDTLSFISQADTIANNGDEEPVPMERVVDGVPDGDIHLKLELTLTLTAYQQGQLFNPEGATMQCDLNQAPTLNETETLWESWVIGVGSGRKSWISSEEATYDPVSGKLTLNMHQEWARIPGHPGFWESWTDTVDLTYQPGQEDVIVGTVTEVNNLSWDRNREQVSTCTSTYSVVGRLR